MVVKTADCLSQDVMIAVGGRHIGPETWLDFLLDAPDAVLGAEHH